MNLLKKLSASLTAKMKADHPSPYKLADDTDQDGWDRRRDGLMADAATPDNTIKTVAYEGDS